MSYYKVVIHTEDVARIKDLMYRQIDDLQQIEDIIRYSLLRIAHVYIKDVSDEDLVMLKLAIPIIKIEAR